MDLELDQAKSKVICEELEKFIRETKFERKAYGPNRLDIGLYKELPHITAQYISQGILWDILFTARVIFLRKKPSQPITYDNIR